MKPNISLEEFQQIEEAAARLSDLERAAIAKSPIQAGDAVGFDGAKRLVLKVDIFDQNWIYWLKGVKGFVYLKDLGNEASQ